MSMQLDKANIYTDLAGLQGIKQLPQGESDEALQAIAKQFESLFINMMMKSMRDSNAVFEEGGLTNSNESKFYRDMFDQQLSLSIASRNGIGIAEALVRQMQRDYGNQTDDLATQDDAQKYNPSLSNPGRASEPLEIAQDQTNFESPEAFVEKLYPKIKEVAGQLGVDPSYMLSQAALETGWGQHMIANADGSNSYNLFGIKADSRWQGEVAQVSTLEYRSGTVQREQAAFRSYQSFDESIEDYADFLQGNDRYQKALSVADDPERFVEELQQAGYATDPAYADKIRDIASRNLFALLNKTGSF